MDNVCGCDIIKNNVCGCEYVVMRLRQLCVSVFAFFFFFSIQMIVSLCVWICVIYTNNLWLCLEWHFCYYYLGPKIKSLELWNLGIVVLFGSTKGLFKCFFFFHINCFWVILRTQVFSSLANMKNYDWSNITFTGSTIDTTFIIH